MCTKILLLVVVGFACVQVSLAQRNHSVAVVNATSGIARNIATENADIRNAVHVIPPNRDQNQLTQIILYPLTDVYVVTCFLIITSLLVGGYAGILILLTGKLLIFNTPFLRGELH